MRFKLFKHTAPRSINYLSIKVKFFRRTEDESNGVQEDGEDSSTGERQVHFVD